MSGINNKVIRKLNDLIELDYDAIEAYEAAIRRLINPAYREQLGVYAQDHRRHTQKLSEMVSRLGGKPSKGPDLMRLLTKGKVLLAKLIGGDRAILTAMRINEEVTNRRYEIAIATDGMDAATLKVVQDNLADERRHRAWLMAELKGEVKKAAARPRAARRSGRRAARKTTA
jgi:uncharacterized protein (TIGR02284 family)